MATAAENLANAQTSLAEAAANAAARLAELDAVPLDERAKMTYTVGVRTYDWNGYRASLMDQIRGLKDQVAAIAEAAQIVAGPFTVVGKAGY